MAVDFSVLGLWISMEPTADWGPLPGFARLIYNGGGPEQHPVDKTDLVSSHAKRHAGVSK